ncbi:MAG: hypothetical protein II737_09035, partial [Mailhella sp.]|nr:hypothetical protein [Mailhella sp.]
FGQHGFKTLGDEAVIADKCCSFGFGGHTKTPFLGVRGVQGKIPLHLFSKSMPKRERLGKCRSGKNKDKEMAWFRRSRTGIAKIRTWLRMMTRKKRRQKWHDT